jgi:hypothetical protein
MRTSGYQALISALNGARNPRPQATAKPCTRGKAGREAVRRPKTDASAWGAAMALRSVLVRAAEDFRRRCVAQSLARTFRSPFTTAGVYIVCFLVFGSEFCFFFGCGFLVSLSLSLSSCSLLFSTAVLYVCSLSLFSFLSHSCFCWSCFVNFSLLFFGFLPPFFLSCWNLSFDGCSPLLSCRIWSFAGCSFFFPVESGRLMEVFLCFFWPSLFTPRLFFLPTSSLPHWMFLAVWRCQEQRSF